MQISLLHTESNIVRVIDPKACTHLAKGLVTTGQPWVANARACKTGYQILNSENCATRPWQKYNNITTTLRYNNLIWGCSTGRSSSLTRKNPDSTIDRQAHLVAERSAGLEEPHARHWPDKYKRHAGETCSETHAFQQTRMHAIWENAQKGEGHCAKAHA